VGPGAHGAPEQRIEAEALVEGPQVVVDPERKAHACDGLLGRGAVRRRGREQDTVARGLADPDDRGLVVDVQQAGERAAAGPQDPVAAAEAGQTEGPAGPNLADCLDQTARYRRWIRVLGLALAPGNGFALRSRSPKGFAARSRAVCRRYSRLSR
jgi:hypothetical protein